MNSLDKHVIKTALRTLQAAGGTGIKKPALLVATTPQNQPYDNRKRVADQKKEVVDITTPRLLIGAEKKEPSRKHRQGDKEFHVTTAYPSDDEFAKKKFRQNKKKGSR